MRLTYNGYGAPCQANPKWCDMVSWLLNRSGNLFYPKHEPIAIWFWAWAYSWGDVQCLPQIKR